MQTMESRANELGEYIVKNRATVRCAAKAFGISKSTVFTDVSKRLRESNFTLYEKVQKVLAYNKAQRHLRGGMATRQKYRNFSK